ncbi:MAG: DUF86 domain-containing protein [Sedimentisphaerales bacterium]|nr:DUF86 domain-containing protein [Sedimentisphaerales bacterium]
MPRFSIKREDKVRLQHMLDAALEIQQYVQYSTREDLNRDRKLVHSLVRLLEIVGEAAAQVSEELRDNIPEIPWPVMIGMRNRLIHAYFSINLNIVWSTSTEDIPLLVAELEKLLGRG